MESEIVPQGQSRIEVQSHYVRTRHCMALWADFGPLFTDYYLHLMQNEIRLAPEHDAMLKEALVAMTLHLAARPRDELSAWTINLNHPVVNLFVTGDSNADVGAGRHAGTVCGRVFTQDVKVGPNCLFFAQAKRPRLPDRASTVEVSGADLLRIAEQYYAQSEQLPARYFRLGGDRYGMVVAQPDHDRAWFDALETAQLEHLGEAEELRLLELRPYQFGCGCTLDLIHAVIAPMARASIDDLFEGADSLRIQCPRCGGRFQVTQDGVRAWLDAHPPAPPRD
jgi:molecular chaperone Hsp33